MNIVEPAANLRAAIEDASRGLIEREALVETIALAAVAGEHVLVIGPPGTAKSEAVRRISRAVGLKYFEYLIGRFTEPSEIFGPVDLRRLREGVVETETSGMLPEAEVAFLDEIFLGSTAILNTLLGILNERMFRRGHTQLPCPLRLCVSAANALPEDESLAAFADRFLVRVFVDPIPDPRLEELLAGGWSLGREEHARSASLADLDTLATAARDADVSDIRPALAQAVRTLRRAGIYLTDRRAVKAQRLIAAAGVLAGRTRPTEADLWPLVLAVPTRDEQATARDCLRDLLSPTENRILNAAAEDASIGPLARAGRLVATATGLLAEPAEGAEREAWLLKLEGVAREIDAGFAREQLPTELAQIREQIVQALAERNGAADESDDGDE
jgi:MoxR-like ATPase